MMPQLQFSCTALNGTGKKGVLSPDEDGYYTVPLGALNVMNSVGEFYTYEGAKDLFEHSGSFIRAMKQNCLKSEEGHPQQMPGESDEAFLRRVYMVDPRNVCAHIAHVELNFNDVRDEAGNPVIAILGKVTPSGPFGAALDRSFKNPRENVCFSIRAFTLNQRRGGVMHRTLREIITWDRVTEPGIHVARKYFSPALECYHKDVSREAAVKAYTEPVAKASSEMSSEMTLVTESIQAQGRTLLNALGWDYDASKIPSSLRDW